jgi:hypothetical protein
MNKIWAVRPWVQTDKVLKLCRSAILFPLQLTEMLADNYGYQHQASRQLDFRSTLWQEMLNLLIRRMYSAKLILSFKYCVSGHYPLSCFYLKHRPVCITKCNVSETGFCLCLQLKRRQNPVSETLPFEMETGFWLRLQVKRRHNRLRNVLLKYKQDSVSFFM